MDIVTGALWAQNDNMARDKRALWEKIHELRGYREVEQQRIVDLEFELAQFVAHLQAEKALSKLAMAELDKAHGGSDKNPLRKQAYGDPEAMRIPSGNRKGQVTTMADHIYLTEFARVFKEKFASIYKHCKSWKDLLHVGISY